jgi:uncharacterized cupin superfamily protein
MTRNREMDLEDLCECDHEPEVATAADSRDPESVIWRCRCGAFTWACGALEGKPTPKRSEP